MARARAASIASSSRLPSPARAFRQRGERRVHLGFGSRVAFTSFSRAICASRTAALSMARTSSGVFLLEFEFVDADDHILAPVDAGLAARRGFLDAQLGNAGLDRLGHAAHRFDLVDDRLRVHRQANGSAPRRNRSRPADRRPWSPGVSFCRMSWVLRAMRAENSVGSAIASSNELVCSDWVPPSTAASASYVVRTMLL